MSAHRAVSEACNAWVRQSCDNYRNFYYRVSDSNGKWQYGDAACEISATAARGPKALNDDCTSDSQCQAGLFCKVSSDDFLHRNDPAVEHVCGKCAAQYAYDGANRGDSRKFQRAQKRPDAR